MTSKANRSLKRGTTVAAILWTCWMIWWSGSLAPADIIILSICGAVFGYVWYVAMRFVLAHMRRSSRDNEETQPGRLYVWTVWTGLMALTGFATSIDAMAVGAGLAFVDVNIYSTAAAIGLATMTMVTIGVMLGRVIGHVAGRRAERSSHTGRAVNRLVPRSPDNNSR